MSTNRMTMLELSIASVPDVNLPVGDVMLTKKAIFEAANELEARRIGNLAFSDRRLVSNANLAC